MIVYLLVLAHIIALFFIEEYVADFKHKRIIFAIAAFLPIILISSLKDISVGSDTNTYFLAYESLKSQPIGSVYRELDLAFCVILSLFAKMGFSFNLTLLVLYSFIYAPFILLSAKLSHRQSVFSLFILLFQMFTFLMSGLRQALAISFCLFALWCLFIIKNKILSTCIFFLLVFLGSRFHGSAFVFLIVLPFFFLIQKKLFNPFYVLPICILLSLLSPYLYSLLFFLFESQFFYDPPKSIMFLDIGFSTYIIMSGCVLFYLLNKKFFLTKINYLFGKVIRTNDANIITRKFPNSTITFYNISLVNCLILCAVSCSQVFIRIGYYFNPFFSLLVSGAFVVIENRKLRIGIFLIIVILLLFFFYFSVYKDNYLSIFPYKFCF